MWKQEKCRKITGENTQDQKPSLNVMIKPSLNESVPCVLWFLHQDMALVQLQMMNSKTICLRIQNQRWSSDPSVWANQERSSHERTIIQVKSYSIQSCVRSISTKSTVKTVCLLPLQFNDTVSREYFLYVCSWFSESLNSNFFMATFFTYNLL